MSLSLLHTKIVELRNKIHWLLALEGIAKSGLYLFLFLATSFVLDFFLNLPWLGRAGLTLVGLGFIAYYALGKIIIPWRLPIADDSLILLIDKAHPKTQERLISAFQFTRLLDSPDYGESREMSLSVIQEAEEILTKVQFPNLLKWQKTLGMLILPIIVFTGLGICRQTFPTFANLSDLWFSRNLLLQDIAWPRRTYMFLVQEQIPVIADKPVHIVITPISQEPVAELDIWYRVSKSHFHFWHQKTLVLENGKFTVILTPGQEGIYFYLDSKIVQSSVYELIPTEPNDGIKNLVNLEFPKYQIIKERGKNLVLKVIARGTVPYHAQVLHRSRPGEWRDEYLEERATGVFSYAFPTLTEDFSFCIQGGDDNDELPLYDVTVLSPPTTQAVAFWYQYPDYTRQPVTPFSSPQTSGTIKALAGTRVMMRVTANIAIGKAECVITDNDKPVQTLLLAAAETAKKLAATADLAVIYKAIAGTALTETKDLADHDLYATFSLEPEFIAKNLRGQILLTAKNGLKDSNPATFYIRVLPDQPPVIQLLSPKEQRLEMTPSGTLPLAFKTSDDYGVAKIALRYKLNRDEKWEELAFGEPQNSAAYGSKEIETKLAWDFSKIQAIQENPSAGSSDKTNLQKNSLLFKLVAGDQKNVKESATITVDIMSKEELIKILEERLQELQRQLRRVAEQQKQFSESISEFTSVQTAFEASDVVWILQMHFSQKAISRDVAGLGNDLAKILERAENNSLWDPTTKNKNDMVQTILQEISKEQGSAGVFQGKSAVAEKAVMDAYQIARQDAGKAKEHLGNTVNQQREIVNDLEKAIQLLGDREDFNEIIKDLENILEQQKKIQPKVKELLDKK